MYDEEAEREAFQRAVLEWRTGKPSSTPTKGETSTSNGLEGRSSGMWNNPFADQGPTQAQVTVHSHSAAEDDTDVVEGFDEEAERAAFQQAVADWRNSQSSSSNQVEAKTASVPSQSRAKSRMSLADGMLDEGKEHEVRFDK